jgi:capsular exopolysaccharide synthesis family protein
MENIRQALERVKASQSAGSEQRNLAGSAVLQLRSEMEIGSAGGNDGQNQEIELNNVHLQSKRIISHDITDPRSRAFDMLRTQVLQSMDLKGWKTLAVTSPTPACGKTLTALNLAISIARQPDRSVLLVDLDFRKPQVAACLGLKCDEGVLSVLEGRTTLSDAIIPARVNNLRFMVLPTASTIRSSELISSRAMTAMLEDIKREYHSKTIIVDLPPILSGDDVIAILPQMDCVLLVAAVGTTTVAQIKECNRHLESAEVVRIALNKVLETSSDHYYYY